MAGGSQIERHDLRAALGDFSLALHRRGLRGKSSTGVKNQCGDLFKMHGEQGSFS
jgi:hypothetical protein